MYSVNDWRNYTLAHAVASKVGQSASASSSPSGKVAKWDWPGGNNSKAYNEWYYSHNKDKWRQYYLNKKNKNNGSRRERLANDLRVALKADSDMASNSAGRKIRGSMVYDAWNAAEAHNPDRFKDFNKARDLFARSAAEARLAKDKMQSAIRPKTQATTGPAYRVADEYSEWQTPSRGASRRRQTR